MVVVSQGVEEYSGNINVRLFCVPRPIMARSESGDQNLPGYFDRVVFMRRSVERLLDPIDDIVSDLKVSLGNLLIFVHFFD